MQRQVKHPLNVTQFTRSGASHQLTALLHPSLFGTKYPVWKGKIAVLVREAVLLCVPLEAGTDLQLPYKWPLLQWNITLVCRVKRKYE